MLAKDFPPSPELQPYIGRYRIRHFVFDAGFVPHGKPFPPRAEQHLVFYPCGHEEVSYTRDSILFRRPASIVTGQYTQRINRFASHPEFLMVEVNLKPGAFHKLTGIPCSALADKETDAESIFGNAIVEVNQRLSSTRNYAEMIGIIEDFLLRLIRKSKRLSLPFDGLLDAVAQQRQFLSVDEMAKYDVPQS